MRFFVNLALCTAFLGFASAAETKVKMEDLPPAVQNAVKEQTKNARLVGLNRETENGQTNYEAETKVSGHSRDMLFDKNGAVVEVEEETPLESIPAAAREAIQKKAGSGQIKRVETVTEGSKVSYEAAITKNGKTSEVAVNADGSSHR
jgi:uncharacterized membrane protein YkoI